MLIYLLKIVTIQCISDNNSNVDIRVKTCLRGTLTTATTSTMLKVYVKTNPVFHDGSKHFSQINQIWQIYAVQTGRQEVTSPALSSTSHASTEVKGSFRLTISSQLRRLMVVHGLHNS